MYFLAGTLTNETLADMKDVPLCAYLTIEEEEEEEDNMIIEECEWEDYADNEDQEAAHNASRHKRYTLVPDDAFDMPAKRNFSWRIIKYTPDLPRATVDHELNMAFNVSFSFFCLNIFYCDWNKYTNLC